jgi:hypothetical protein
VTSRRPKEQRGGQIQIHRTDQHNQAFISANNYAALERVSDINLNDIDITKVIDPPRRCFHLIVVRGFEYARDPESYTSSSVATGRASLAGQVKG